MGNNTKSVSLSVKATILQEEYDFHNQLKRHAEAVKSMEEAVKRCLEDASKISNANNAR